MKFEVGDFVDFNFDNDDQNSTYHYCKVVAIISSEAFRAQVIESNCYTTINRIYIHSISSFHKITDKKLIDKLNKMMVFK